MPTVNKQTGYARRKRQDRLIEELDHDPYHANAKLKAPATCSGCGAVYLRGKWTWATAPADATAVVCPACQRIEDRVPAAFLTLRGDFVQHRKAEIMALINNYVQRQRTEHPLKRIMDCKEQEDALVLTLTDAHLARGIGEALHSAYEGDLSYRYTKHEIMLRVIWQRD